MKQFFALIAVFLLFATMATGQTQKTLVKTLALAPTTQSLQFNLPAVVEIQEWDEPTIRLVTTVTTDVEDNVLKALAAAGRYGYAANTQLTTGVTVVTMPKKAIEVVIGGQPLEDHLTVIVYVPRGINYEIVGANNPDLIQ